MAYNYSSRCVLPFCPVTNAAAGSCAGGPSRKDLMGRAHVTWVEETAQSMLVGAGIFAVFDVALDLGITLSLLMATATGAALFLPWMPRRESHGPTRIRRRRRYRGG